jgi:hypothetical protein
MKLTASKLRENIYKILDEVLETGVPVEIERKNRILRLVPVDPSPGQGKLEKLVEHQGFLLSDPEDLVHLDWSGEWKP